MKKLMYVICLLLSIKGLAKNTGKELNINVLVTSESGTLLNNVDVVTSNYQVSYRKGEVKFRVPEQSNLLITFQKEGYISKTIWINTETGSIKSAFTDFEIELVMNEKNEELDYQDLDFPIAKISFNSQLRKYEYDHTYNSEMKKTYNSILTKIEDI